LAGHVARTEGLCEAYRDLVGKTEVKRPLGRREDNKMDFSRNSFGAWTVLIWLRIGTGDGFL